jgi:hypothetical protein
VEWLNPVEWLAWLYGKFFLNSPYLGGAVIAVVFALFGLSVWVKAMDQYKEEHAALVPETQQIPTAGAAVVVRNGGKWHSTDDTVVGRIEDEGQIDSKGLSATAGDLDPVEEQIDAFIKQSLVFVSGSRAKEWSSKVRKYLDSIGDSEAAKEFARKSTTGEKREFLMAYMHRLLKRRR